MAILETIVLNLGLDIKDTNQSTNLEDFEIYSKFDKTISVIEP
jgi:hypothetical protein